MAYSPTMVANNILERSFRDSAYISPMKLQKILYFVASEYQKQTGRQLLEDKFQTWTHGPVIYGVYDEFRSFSRANIKRFARNAEGEALKIDEFWDPDLRECLDRVWAATKNKGAIELSKLTHAENSAWDRAYQKESQYLSNDDISADVTYKSALGI